MSNHCQPPKYSCHRYCCGDEKGNYDRDDTAYDDDDDDDGGDVDEIVEGLQVQSVWEARPNLISEDTGRVGTSTLKI